MSSSASSATRYPALFLFHGGGPMPLLNDPAHAPMIAEVRKHVRDYFTTRRPTAIVVVSAHYETRDVVKVGSAAQPKMLFDYGGFPPETYKYRYGAPGNPELAERMVALLTKAGIKAEAEPTRALDHGVFVPLMLMFPDADIPVIPLSVLRSQVASEHIAIGKALSELRSEGVFFLGSGASSHNFEYLLSGRPAGGEFNAFLAKVVTDPALSAEDRAKALDGYLKFPGAHETQKPAQAEHLMPLFTVLGTAEGNQAGAEVSRYDVMSNQFRHFLFES